jgi:hypothetical protein
MPITVKSTGGGSVTLTAPVTGSDLTLTMPSISGTIYATTGGVIPVSEGGTGLSTMTAANNALYSTSSSAVTAGTLPVAAGGTGSSTLTANNVLLGNGTSALQSVAPGSNGNVLTSNGTTWTSSAPSGGVTSVSASGGITVSASTGAVTISQGLAYVDIGMTVWGYTNGSSQNPNTTVTGNTIYPCGQSVDSTYQFATPAGSGTWRCFGYQFSGNTATNWVRIA